MSSLDKFLDDCLRFTLLNRKALKQVFFAAILLNKQFISPKEPFSEQILKEPFFFFVWRTLFL